MRKSFTIEDLKQSACAHLNQHLFAEEKKTKQPRKKKVSKEKEFIVFKLQEFARENKLTLSREYMFHEERDWRFDWCYLSEKIAFEYEGIIAKKSRHTTITGFTGDADKYNAAAEQGWRIYRYTALNYLDLVVDLSRIKLKKGQP